MSDDLISRQAAIDALESIGSLDTNADREYARSVFETLPSAQPERKTGHWIDVFGDVPIYNAGGFTEKRKIGVKCSNCQRLNTWCEFDYCPHCGAKMEGETE